MYFFFIRNKIRVLPIVYTESVMFYSDLIIKV
nr:MAG TPA: Protein of unknown function (DUF1117) [Bacteriophage sp.]